MLLDLVEMCLQVAAYIWPYLMKLGISRSNTASATQLMQVCVFCELLGAEMGEVTKQDTYSHCVPGWKRKWCDLTDKAQHRKAHRQGRANWLFTCVRTSHLTHMWKILHANNYVSFYKKMYLADALHFYYLYSRLLKIIAKNYICFKWFVGNESVGECCLFCSSIYKIITAVIYQCARLCSIEFKAAVWFMN